MRVFFLFGEFGICDCGEGGAFCEGGCEDSLL